MNIPIKMKININTFAMLTDDVYSIFTEFSNASFPPYIPFALTSRTDTASGPLFEVPFGLGVLRVEASTS